MERVPSDAAEQKQEVSTQASQDAAQTPEDNSPVLSLRIGEGEPATISLSERAEVYDKRIKSILAYFIYELEADSYSRCELTEGSRVIELNDFEILEITQLSEQERTYRYEVKPCISAAIGHQFKTPPKEDIQ